LVAELALVALVAVVANVAKVAKVAKVARVARVAFVAEPAAMLDWASQVGAAAALLWRTWPDVPAAEYACAVPVPYPIPPLVAVAVEFVPPEAIGRTELFVAVKVVPSA
jgi:hypothetical protein